MLRIQSTKNYDQFKFFPCNRDVLGNALVESIKERNLLDSNPIKVTEDMWVVDGQHRLAAAKFLGIEIFFIVDPKLTEDDIAILNYNQKSWSVQNFLDFYVYRKNPFYMFIDEMVKHYRFPLHFLISACHPVRECYDLFRKGELHIESMKKKREQLEVFSQAYALCNSICDRKKELISNEAMRTLWSIVKNPNYNHKKFMEKTDKYRDLVKDAFKLRKSPLIIPELEKLYNFKDKKKDKKTSKRQVEEELEFQF